MDGWIVFLLVVIVAEGVIFFVPSTLNKWKWLIGGVVLLLLGGLLALVGIV